MPQMQFGVNWPELIQGNVQKVRQAQDDRRIDVLFVNNVDNVRYLTGYVPLSSPAFVHSGWAALPLRGDGAILFPIPFYVGPIKRKFGWIQDVRPAVDDMVSVIRDVVAEVGAKKGRVGFDGYLLYTMGKALEAALPDAEIVNADDVMTAARKVKSAQELAILQRCVSIAEIGMRAGIEACVEGNREYQVAAAIEYAMRREGAEGYPFMSMVSSGENASIMQELTTDRYLRRGDAVVLDLGCMFEGYYSDFARTVVVGGEEPHFPEARIIYGVVRSALEQVISAMRPGARCGELDALARRVIRDAGYGEFEYQHFLGHGIGMTVWEYPLLGPGVSVVQAGDGEPTLEPGMVINVEPGIFKPGVAGARLEQTVLVTPTGHEIWTRTEYCAALT